MVNVINDISLRLYCLHITSRRHTRKNSGVSVLSENIRRNRRGGPNTRRQCEEMTPQFRSLWPSVDQTLTFNGI